MPVFHSYVNDDGYYITARPSDVGNITYQVRKQAELLLIELGYKDESDIPWGIINPLRSAGYIYTNNQGVDETQDNAPTLDPTRLSEATEKELQALFNYLKSREDIPKSIYKNIKKKAESKENLLDEIAKRIHPKFPNQQTRVHVSWASDAHDHKISEIIIELKGEEIEHAISMLGGPTVDEWAVSHPYEDSWKGVARVTSSLEKIMKAFYDINSETSVKILHLKHNESVVL
jgi:hypothetical protein